MLLLKSFYPCDGNVQEVTRCAIAKYKENLLKSTTNSLYQKRTYPYHNPLEIFAFVYLCKLNDIMLILTRIFTLQWHHVIRHVVSNHQQIDWLFKRTSSKARKLTTDNKRSTILSSVRESTGFHSQKDSNAETFPCHVLNTWHPRPSIHSLQCAVSESASGFRVRIPANKYSEIE